MTEHEETFSRFKYAEERAHGLNGRGIRTWSLSRGPDETTEEDGETYTNETYVVRWTT